jgi:cobalt-zinc-cadmium efflux system protein
VAAFVNGLAMLLLVVLIVVEAISRLLDPQPVTGLGVLVVAVIGLLANLFVAFLIGRGERNLNTRAVLLHVIGDVIGSVAAITAGAVIYYTGWQPIDALLSLVIAMLILGSTVRLLLDALHVLMEGVPAGLTIEEVGRAIGELNGVRAVHDLHIWNISSGQMALSAHVDLDNLDGWAALLESARQMLQARFGIAHVTLQPEPAGGINPGYRAHVRILPQEDQSRGSGRDRRHGHDH